MILALLILIPLAGGLLAWLSTRLWFAWARRVALTALAGQLLLVAALWIRYSGDGLLAEPGRWLTELDLPWIPAWGARIHLAMDGISLLLIALTGFLGIVAVAASWQSVRRRTGFFYFSLLWLLAAVTGILLATDLFLFYFFWELMLVPLYLLIGIWGHENRFYATIKFVIFTQAGSLLMLVSILGLYFVHGDATGSYTFEYSQLLGTSMPYFTQMMLMLGFFAAFAVKLPMVPLHTWLPDAHTQAPTAGSVVLAGLVLKVGAYGMLRFLVPLFPEAAADFSIPAMVLAVAGIIYGAVLAYSQTDLKRMVAYTSISHMGFVLLGIFAWNQLALLGVVVIMLAHGISTGALFVIVGDLQDRLHTRELSRMGGLWPMLPRMGGSGLLFALASLGLPGLGNFVGELLVLLGSYQVNVPLTILASLGFIVSTAYALRLVQKVFFGESRNRRQLNDYGGRETALMAALIAAIVCLGLYPQPVLNAASGALDTLRGRTPGYHQAETSQSGGGGGQEDATGPGTALTGSGER